MYTGLFYSNSASRSLEKGSNPKGLASSVCMHKAVIYDESLSNNGIDGDVSVCLSQSSQCHPI